MDRKDAVQKLTGIIQDVRVGMLTTVDDRGALRSRPMETPVKGYDGALWFFTAVDSPKSREIENHNKVNVSYANRERQQYVSLSGTATLVRDSAKAAELWEPMAEPWFPKGPSDPNLGLIRVDIENAEYWDADTGKMVYLAGLGQG